MVKKKEQSTRDTRETREFETDNEVNGESDNYHTGDTEHAETDAGETNAEVSDGEVLNVTVVQSRDVTNLPSKAKIAAAPPPLIIIAVLVLL